MAYKSAKMELSRPKSVVLYLSLVSISLVILFGTIGLNSTSTSNSKLRVERNQNNLKRASKGFEPKISNKPATIVEPEIDCAGNESVDTLEKVMDDPVVNDNTDFIPDKTEPELFDPLFVPSIEHAVILSAISVTPEDLFGYVEANDLESFRRASPANLHKIWDSKGFNLLHRAASKANLDFITFILQNSLLNIANEKTRDGRGLNAVHLVIESAENDFEVIKQCLVKLIESGFDIDRKSGAADDESGYTSLYSAIKKNNQLLVDFILTFKVDVNAMYDGYPLLHHAIAKCDVDIVNSLIRAQASVKSVNKFNRRAIHEAAFHRRADIIHNWCINNKKDIDLNDRTPKYPSYLPKKSENELKNAAIMYKATALHYAARNGDSATAKVLRKAGAVLDKKDAYGKTPEFYDHALVLKEYIYN